MGLRRDRDGHGDWASSHWRNLHRETGTRSRVLSVAYADGDIITGGRCLVRVRDGKWEGCPLS